MRKALLFALGFFLMVAGRSAAAERPASHPSGNAILPGMGFIPSGAFWMGDTFHGDEEPVHEVFLEGFYMDLYEVTNVEYERHRPDHPRSPFSPCDQCPVTLVSWEEAEDYCRARGKRLPAEAEWEKAGQGPQGYRYAYGDDYDAGQAQAGKALEEGATAVGSYAPNGYGLFDMSGNVWEWVMDWYDERYYRHSPLTNPQGPGQGAFRGFRGGSWNVDVCYSRIKNRDGGIPTERYHFVGFRCAQTIPAGDSLMIREQRP